MAMLRYDASDDSPNNDWYRNRCKICEEKNESKSEASDYMQEIISILYSHNDLDLKNLEKALDNLCHYFDMPLCPGDLMIERFKEIKYV